MWVTPRLLMTRVIAVVLFLLVGVCSVGAGERGAEVVQQSSGALFSALGTIQSVQVDALFGVGQPRVVGGVGAWEFELEKGGEAGKALFGGHALTTAPLG